MARPPQMRTLSPDVAIIGAGTAGLRARHEAAKLGARTLLVEDGPYGTTCARVGCMPSKLLIAAAEAAHAVASAGTFGIEVAGPVHVRGAQVLERVRSERDRYVGFVVESTEQIPEHERLRGHARFLQPGVLAVGDDTRVEARAVVVATGSSPWVPTTLAPAGDALLTSDDVFALSDLPASVAVVGTGVIGLELGQALHRLGVRTALFSRSDRVGPGTDPQVARAVRDVLGRELDLRLSVHVSAERVADGVLVRWLDADGTRHEERFERLLCAAGRHPRLAGLDLERGGAELDERERPVVDPRTMQCGMGPLFLAGDVSDHRPVLHEAADEGTVAGQNAARFPDVRAHPRRTPLEIVFTHPEIALVGTAHRDLPPDEVEIGHVDYADQGRARVMAQNRGLVRIYALRKCGTLIGAEMFGPRVEHTAHLLAWAVQAHLTVSQALEMPYYHPVIEEGIRTGMRDLCTRLRLAAAEKAAELECGPGT